MTDLTIKNSNCMEKGISKEQKCNTENTQKIKSLRQGIPTNSAERKYS